jgi:cytochrome c553
MNSSIRIRWQNIIQLVTCVVVLAAGTQAAAQTARPPQIVSACAPCHGVDGNSGTVEVPNLAGQRGIYLRRQLLAFRSGQRRHPEMNRVLRNLKDREIDQLVIYYTLLPPP